VTTFTKYDDEREKDIKKKYSMHRYKIIGILHISKKVYLIEFIFK